MGQLLVRQMQGGFLKEGKQIAGTLAVFVDSNKLSYIVYCLSFSLPLYC